MTYAWAVDLTGAPPLVAIKMAGRMVPNLVIAASST